MKHREFVKRSSSPEGAAQLGASLQEKLPGYKVQLGEDSRGYYAHARRPAEPSVKASRKKGKNDDDNANGAGEGPSERGGEARDGEA